MRIDSTPHGRSRASGSCHNSHVHAAPAINLTRRVELGAANRNVQIRVCVQLQALSLMLWSYGKAIPPSAESAKLLSVVSDEVTTLCLPHL